MRRIKMKLLCEECIQVKGLTGQGVGITGRCEGCGKEKTVYLIDETLTPDGVDFGEMEGYST